LLMRGRKLLTLDEAEVAAEANSERLLLQARAASSMVL
jgi:hypothetical protein